jgi:hypothetical protein
MRRQVVGAVVSLTLRLPAVPVVLCQLEQLEGGHTRTPAHILGSIKQQLTALFTERLLRINFKFNVAIVTIVQAP